MIIYISSEININIIQYSLTSHLLNPTTPCLNSSPLPTLSPPSSFSLSLSLSCTSLSSILLLISSAPLLPPHSALTYLSSSSSMILLSRRPAHQTTMKTIQLHNIFSFLFNKHNILLSHEDGILSYCKKYNIKKPLPFDPPRGDVHGIINSSSDHSIIKLRNLFI